MPTSVQIPYSNMPPDTQTISLPTSDSASTSIKPLPMLPVPITTYLHEAPYRDDPSSPIEPCPPQNTPLIPPSVQPPHYQHHSPPLRPYTDLPSPSEAASPTSLYPHDDDVPLARLMLLSQAHARVPAYSYPLEAPPSYSVAVRQSFRNTLDQYFPNGQVQDAEVDEESGVEALGPDELSHSIEKVVAMLTVAILLLILSGVMAWIALGSGVWS